MLPYTCEKCEFNKSSWPMEVGKTSVFCTKLNKTFPIVNNDLTVNENSYRRPEECPLTEDEFEDREVDNEEIFPMPEPEDDEPEEEIEIEGLPEIDDDDADLFDDYYDDDDFDDDDWLDNENM